MKKILLFIIVFVSIIGCKKELVKKPNNLIERDKMVNIMYDLSLLDGIKMQDPTLADSLKFSTNEYVFRKYKIDSAQFAKSNMYYAADYQAYEKMYNKVKARIDSDKKELNSVVKAKATKDSLMLIKKEKLKLKKEADPTKKAKQKLKLKKEADTSKKALQIKVSKPDEPL